ncbi:hypothetical protein NEMBOFW57_008020 [Staphylotrichum longicolle]|uniref:non-specific serine/threonine protein kinase n=1 Tax=Staphylotrichum longicolle TaxID=669026 RepID=A0AAD4EQX0_9PEZI|nr:hypothetical protein NEMBOFW57_008020 [Staphylotrichum longicolle]
MAWQPFDIGRFHYFSHAWLLDTHEVGLYDPETRRVITVTLPNPDGHFNLDDGEPDDITPVNKAGAALIAHLDDLPPETVGLKIDEAGKVLSFWADPERDWTPVLDHLAVEKYQFPPHMASKTVLRSELTELRRFVVNVDLVSYTASPSIRPHNKGDNRYIFKYAIHTLIPIWTELQILARLPPHPHRMTLDRLVLDETTGSRVVGFTTKYIDSETLDKSRPPFKLKWLRQLMQTVDDLNLRHGIIHQDIAHRNLLIDPETDSIVLFDFNTAYRVGVKKEGGLDNEGKWGERDDVKGVLIFLYEYITRDPALKLYWLHMLDEKDFRDPAKWIKHPDVELDDDVAEFYCELMAWARSRRAGEQLTHYTEAPEPLDWPSLPEEARLIDNVANRHKEGLPYLHWTRPLLSKLDPTRRLLATGRYADDEPVVQGLKQRRRPSAATTSEPAKKRLRGGRAGKDDGAKGVPVVARDVARVGRTLRSRQATPPKRRISTDSNPDLSAKA